MDESNRVPQRTRPRPYDLRRKVLLKNFLREQMTHIPLPPPRLPIEALEDDPVAEQEDTMSSVGNEENIEQSHNKQLSVSAATEPIPSTSAQSFSDEIPPESQEPEAEPDKTTQPTLTRLSNLLRQKISSTRSKRKGITKAKMKIKGKSSPHKGVLHTVNKTNNVNGSTKSKKSIFAMFKTRRNKKRKEQTLQQEAQTSSPVAETKSSTSNQSVQTDASFTQEEFNNMEQSNRCLREENRLLSESLSSFMSDYKFQLSPIKIPYGTDSYITSSGTSSVSNNISQQTSVDVAKQTDSQDKTDSKVRIPRSKSMQERLDKRMTYRPKLRTRSMNYGLSKRFYDSSSLVPRECNPPSYGRGYAQDHSHRLAPRRGKYKANSFSTFDSYSRHRVPMATPDVNARMLPHRATVLKNLPINNTNRAIVRRSSMPERTSYQSARPVLRHKSTRVAGYNREDAYDMQHTNHNYNGSMPNRRRSNGSDYGRPVPFQNLPPEAFY